MDTQEKATEKNKVSFQVGNLVMPNDASPVQSRMGIVLGVYPSKYFGADYYRVFWFGSKNPDFHRKYCEAGELKLVESLLEI